MYQYVIQNQNTQAGYTYGFFCACVAAAAVYAHLLFACFDSHKTEPSDDDDNGRKKPTHVGGRYFSVHEICVFVVCHSSDLRRRRRIVRFDYYYYILPIIFRRYKRGFRRRTADVIYHGNTPHERHTKRGWACAIIRKILCVCI